MPPISTPMATATSAALNRITCYLLVSGRAGELPSARLATVRPEAADVLGNRVLSRRGRRARRSAAYPLLLAEANGELRRRWRWRGGHRREGAAVGHACFKIAELAFEVRLQPAAVLTLERAQVVHPALKFLALGEQRAHGLAASLGEHLVRLAAGPAERLVRLAAGVGDRLVGGLLRKRQNAGGRVHVVLVVRPLVLHGLGAAHWLLHHGGGLHGHRVRPGVRQRRA